MKNWKDGSHLRKTTDSTRLGDHVYLEDEGKYFKSASRDSSLKFVFSFFFFFGMDDGVVIRREIELGWGWGSVSTT